MTIREGAPQRGHEGGLGGNRPGVALPLVTDLRGVTRRTGRSDAVERAPDTAAYDRIHAQHAAERPAIEVVANAALSCTIPGYDPLSAAVAVGGLGGCDEAGGCGCGGGDGDVAQPVIEFIDLELTRRPAASTPRICL